MTFPTFCFLCVAGLTSQLVSMKGFKSTTISTTPVIASTSTSNPPSNYSPEQQITKSRRFWLGNLSMLPVSKVTGDVLSMEKTTAQSQWKKQIEEYDEYAKWLETFGSIL